MIKRVLACSTSDGSYSWFLVDKNVYDRKVGGPEYKLLHDILTREAYFHKDSEVQPYEKVIRSDNNRFSAIVDGLNFDIKLGSGTVVQSYVISRYNESYRYNYQDKGWVLEPWWPWIKEPWIDDISVSMKALINNMKLIKNDLNNEPLSARCGIIAELFKTQHDDGTIDSNHIHTELEPAKYQHEEIPEAQPQNNLDIRSKLEVDHVPEKESSSASEPEAQLANSLNQPTVSLEPEVDTVSAAFDTALYPDEQTIDHVNEEVDTKTHEELNEQLDKANINQPKSESDSVASLPPIRKLTPQNETIQNQEATVITVQPKKQKVKQSRKPRIVSRQTDPVAKQTPTDTVVDGMTPMKPIKKVRIPPLESSIVAPSTPDQSVGVDLPEAAAPTVTKKEAWGEQTPVTQEVNEVQDPERLQPGDEVIDPPKVQNWAQKRELQPVDQGKPYNLNQRPRFQLTRDQIKDIKAQNRAAREEKERLKKQELQMQNA